MPIVPSPVWKRFVAQALACASPGRRGSKGRPLRGVFWFSINHVLTVTASAAVAVAAGLAANRREEPVIPTADGLYGMNDTVDGPARDGTHSLEESRMFIGS